MDCTWEWEDGTVCRKPADAMRVQWLPEKRVWWYCKRHINGLRRRSPDEDAWRLYQTATYPVTTTARHAVSPSTEGADTRTICGAVT